MKTKTLCLVAVITALLNTTGCSGDDDSVFKQILRNKELK